MSKHDRQQQPEPESRPWRGFAMQQTAQGLKWVRVALPEGVAERYRVREPEPPDLRAIVGARIANEIQGDDIITGRGWPK